MWIQALCLSGALALGTLALPASADDGLRIVVRSGAHGHERYDASYAAHHYRHYVRPYIGYLWTNQAYLNAPRHGWGPGYVYRGPRLGLRRGHDRDRWRGRQDGAPRRFTDFGNSDHAH